MRICLIRASITLSGLSSSYLSGRLASRGFCGTAVAGALDLTGYLGDELCSAVWGQSLGAQIVHCLQVVVDVLAIVQVQRAGELLDVHDVWQFRLGETQESERAARGGVTAAAERDHLNGDLRQAGHLGQAG